LDLREWSKLPKVIQLVRGRDLNSVHLTPKPMPVLITPGGSKDSIKRTLECPSADATLSLGLSFINTCFGNMNWLP